MLKSDRIELAILTLIIDPHEANGRMLVLPQLMKYFEEKAGPCKVQEIVEALIVLSNKHLVSVGKYRGQDFLPRQPSDDEVSLLTRISCARRFPVPAVGLRSCLPRPKPESSSATSEKNGPRALKRIKAFLETALTPAPPVFVSSDYVSIESGEEWYLEPFSRVSRGRWRSSRCLTGRRGPPVDQFRSWFWSGSGVARDTCRLAGLVQRHHRPAIKPLSHAGTHEPARTRSVVQDPRLASPMRSSMKRF